MFERYTEKARRCIFFARYEASQFGSPYIEAEHLLLGLLREDKNLFRELQIGTISIDSIRAEIAKNSPSREKINTSVDLPMSNRTKRILAYGAEEAERLCHKHIGSEHLLLGLMREPSLAAEILTKPGITLDAARRVLAFAPSAQPADRNVKLVNQLRNEFAPLAAQLTPDVEPVLVYHL